MKRLIVIDASVSGLSRTALLRATDLLWRVRRLLSADVMPVIAAESGYSPCGAGWTADFRTSMREAYDKTSYLVQPAVSYSLNMLPILSPADEAAISGGTFLMGLPALLADNPKSSYSSSWIITSSAIHARIFREALFDHDRRITVLGPKWKPQPVYVNTNEAVQTPTLVSGGILAVAGTAAISASLEQVVARLRALTKHDVQFITTKQLPAVKLPASIPAELAEPSNTMFAASSETRIMQRVALAVGRDVLRRGQSQNVRVEVFREWLRAAPPSLVIVGNDRWVSDAALVCAARDLGIPSLCVQDGVAADIPIWWTRLADWTASNGTQLRDILVSLGISGNRIRVTGQPRYDKFLAKFNEVSYEQARTTIGICGESHNPVALVVLQEAHDASYVRELLAALFVVMQRRALTVVIRPHPATSMEIETMLPRELMTTGRLMIDRKSSVPIALRAADIAIGQYSTMLIEAVLMGIPAIVFLPSPTPVVLDLAAAGVAYAATHTREELINQCMALLDQPIVSESNIYASECLLGSLGGNAADRVARLVLEIIAPQ